MHARILLVDPVPTSRILMRATLGEAFAAARQAASGAEALEALAEDRPDVAMINGQPPDMTAADLTRMIKKRFPAVPVLIIANAGAGAEVVEGLRAGADAVLRRPVDGALLLAQLRTLKRALGTQEEWQAREETARDLGFSEPGAAWDVPPRVALVGASDQAERVARWMAELSEESGLALLAMDPQAALTQAPADAYVLHADLDGPHTGLAMVAELRARAASRNAAVIVALRAEDRAGAVMALDTGASDILTDRAATGELALRLALQLRRKADTDRMRRSVEAGLRLAALDPLTGLWNRRYALPHLDRIAQRASETDQSWAVVLFDIDRFKQVNDRFGHAAGDRVLAEVADRLRQHTRAVDLVARIGGEEFLVALPEGDLAVARQVAERIRLRVGETPIAVPGLQPVTVTVSAGIALGAPGVPASEVIVRADRALMRCKSGGRNQVRVARSAA
jgi:two-component system, cell cycle response regulator